MYACCWQNPVVGEWGLQVDERRKESVDYLSLPQQHGRVGCCSPGSQRVFHRSRRLESSSWVHGRIWDHGCFGMLKLSAPAILVLEGPKAWRLKKSWVNLSRCLVVFWNGVLGAETVRLPCDDCPVACSYSTGYRGQAPAVSQRGCLVGHVPCSQGTLVPSVPS